MRQNTTLFPHIFHRFLHISHVENFSTWQSVMWRITPPDHLSCKQISPQDQIFSTGTARGARGKYEVCLWCIWCSSPQPLLSSSLLFSACVPNFLSRYSGWAHKPSQGSIQGGSNAPMTFSTGSQDHRMRTRRWYGSRIKSRRWLGIFLNAKSEIKF